MEQLFVMVQNDDFNRISDILMTIENPELLATVLGMLIDQWQADTGTSYEAAHSVLEILLDVHKEVNAMEGAMLPRPNSPAAKAIRVGVDEDGRVIAKMN